MAGIKKDKNKPKVSLIPPIAILEMAKSFTYGAQKYSPDNYKKGINFRRLIDAAYRHILSIADGVDVDEESGNLHAASVMSNMAMLIYMMKHKPEMDDRYKKKNAKTKKRLYKR